jgi:DNA-directed RNA polymerase beta subunit
MKHIFHLEADGLPLPEKYLEGGDVLVGKTSPQDSWKNRQVVHS